MGFSCGLVYVGLNELMGLCGVKVGCCVLGGKFVLGYTLIWGFTYTFDLDTV